MGNGLTESGAKVHKKKSDRVLFTSGMVIHESLMEIE
jgi:hypothetical protein